MFCVFVSAQTLWILVFFLSLGDRKIVSLHIQRHLNQCGAAEMVLVHQNNTRHTNNTLVALVLATWSQSVPIFGNKRTAIFLQSCFINVFVVWRKKIEKLVLLILC